MEPAASSLSLSLLSGPSTVEELFRRADKPFIRAKRPWHRRIFTLCQDLYGGGETHVKDSWEKGPLLYVRDLLDITEQRRNHLLAKPQAALMKCVGSFDGKLARLDNGTSVLERGAFLFPLLPLATASIILPIYLPDMVQFIRFFGWHPRNFAIAWMLLNFRCADRPIIAKFFRDRVAPPLIALGMYFVTLIPSKRHLLHSWSYKTTVVGLSATWLVLISFAPQLVALFRFLKSSGSKPAPKLAGLERTEIRELRDAWLKLGQFLKTYVDYSDISDGWKEYFLRMKALIDDIVQILTEALPKEDGLTYEDDHKAWKFLYWLAAGGIGAVSIYGLRKFPWPQTDYIVWTIWVAGLLILAVVRSYCTVDDIRRLFSRLVAGAFIALPIIYLVDTDQTRLNERSFVIGLSLYNFVVSNLFCNLVGELIDLFFIGLSWLLYASFSRQKTSMQNEKLSSISPK